MVTGADFVLHPGNSTSMLKLFVLAALCLAMSAIAQKPCCGPPQYMGGLGQTIGQTHPIYGPMSMSVIAYGAWDYSGSRYGYDVFIAYTNGTSLSFRIIQDYNKGSQWIIVDTYKYCEKQPVMQPEPSVCVPANATYLTSSYIGGMGGVLIDSWIDTLQYPKDPVEGASSIGVVRTSCLPASTQFQGNVYQGSIPVPTLLFGGWLNITVGIPEPQKWFTLPSFCNQEDNGVGSSVRPLALPDLAVLHASLNLKKRP